MPVRCNRLGFHPWVGKIPWRRAWQPTPVFLPGESHGQRSLAGYSPRGRTESDTTERLSTHTRKSKPQLYFRLLLWSFFSSPKISPQRTIMDLQDFHTQYLAVRYISPESTFHQHREIRKSILSIYPKLSNAKWEKLRRFIPWHTVLFLILFLHYSVKLFHLYWNTECSVFPLDLVTQIISWVHKEIKKNNMIQPQPLLPSCPHVLSGLEEWSQDIWEGHMFHGHWSWHCGWCPQISLLHSVQGVAGSGCSVNNERERGIILNWLKSSHCSACAPTKCPFLAAARIDGREEPLQGPTQSSFC